MDNVTALTLNGQQGVGRAPVGSCDHETCEGRCRQKQAPSVIICCISRPHNALEGIMTLSEAGDGGSVSTVGAYLMEYPAHGTSPILS